MKHSTSGFSVISDCINSKSPVMLCICNAMFLELAMIQGFKQDNVYKGIFD